MAVQENSFVTRITLLFSLLSSLLSLNTWGGSDEEVYKSWAIVQEKSEGSISLSQTVHNFHTSQQVVVAVIDTGIDFRHPFLKDNLYTPQGPVSENQYGQDFSKKDKITSTPFDEHGHGTHVAGIIKSVFSDVKILALKYYAPQNSGQENLNATIKALEYAIESGVDIINYSGGGPEASDEELKMLKLAEKKGILVVAAAGNEHSDIDQEKNGYFPASYRLKNIVTVTAHDQQAQILPSSNWGAMTVDLSAPGYLIKSSIPYGRSGSMTGTSQATAFVTGVAALIKSRYPHLEAAMIRKILTSSVTLKSEMKTKCSSGGILNTSLALVTAKKVAEKSGVNAELKKPLFGTL